VADQPPSDGRDFVLLYAPPWFGPTRFSKHHLALHLAREGDRVLYVEAPLTPLNARQGRHFVAELARAQLPPRRVGEQLWTHRQFAPVPYHAATALTSTRAANRLSQRLLAPQLRRDLRRLGMTRPILIAGLPHAVDLVPLLPHAAVVYHCADDYAHVRGFPSTLPTLEAELCRRADLVVTTSETLARDRQPLNPRTYWVPNGAEIEHFARDVAPAGEVARLPGPRIGFVGGLSEWVDFELLARLARARPTWSLVLVGPYGVDATELGQLPNVHLLGPRPYARVPSYLAAMDVALIPFKQDPVTFHADPIKAYEYLAAGVPVVATDLPALRRLQPVVRLASTPEAFEREIAAALAEGRDAGRAARQAEATRHGWRARFDQIDHLLADLPPTCAS
jgi:glycosyltransferase involved in cell wall biosynthesis